MIGDRKHDLIGAKRNGLTRQRWVTASAATRN